MRLEHYFTNNSNLESHLRELEYTHGGRCLRFYSDNGVFSKDKVDYASSLLVETFLKNNKDANGKLLDVGCGYGFIGITLGLILNIEVELVDINKRALHLCERNIKLNKVSGVAYESDTYEMVKNKYEYIISNPPIRAGKEVVLKILKGAKEYLKPDGELWFVINKNQGAKSIENSLKNDYKIQILQKSKGFYIFRAKIIDKNEF